MQWKIGRDGDQQQRRNRVAGCQSFQKDNSQVFRLPRFIIALIEHILIDESLLGQRGVEAKHVVFDAAKFRRGRRRQFQQREPNRHQKVFQCRTADFGFFQSATQKRVVGRSRYASVAKQCIDPKTPRPLLSNDVQARSDDGALLDEILNGPAIHLQGDGSRKMPYRVIP